MRLAEEIVAQRHPVRHAVRRRAARGPALPGGGGSARERRASSSRSRPTDSASTPRSPNAWPRLPIRSIQISLDGDTQETYERQRPGGSLAKVHAACRAVAGRRPAARSDLRAHPAQCPRAPGRHRAGAGPRRLPFQHRQADAHRHRRAPVGPAGAGRRGLPDVPATPWSRDRSALDKQWNSAIFRSTIEDALRGSLDDPPATMLVLPNGWVKVAAALPYICADLRRESLAAAWEAYRGAWRSDAVHGSNTPRDRG